MPGVETPIGEAAARPTGASSRQAPDALVTAIRDDLANGGYSPHERLVEADLVERYGAPRAAVREALIQLASEGLVERLPHRGARVRGMTLTEAIEIAEVRLSLETIAVEKAAERATPDERRAIAALAEAMCEASASGDVGTYLHLNARFHLSIHEMARHEIIRAILLQFSHRPIDRFFPEPFRPVPPMASVEAHRRIAEAIADADAGRARAEMHEHLVDLLELLQSFERRSGSAGAEHL